MITARREPSIYIKQNFSKPCVSFSRQTLPSIWTQYLYSMAWLIARRRFPSAPKQGRTRGIKQGMGKPSAAKVSMEDGRTQFGKDLVLKRASLRSGLLIQDADGNRNLLSVTDDCARPSVSGRHEPQDPRPENRFRHGEESTDLRPFHRLDYQRVSGQLSPNSSCRRLSNSVCLNH